MKLKQSLTLFLVLVTMLARSAEPQTVIIDGYEANGHRVIAKLKDQAAANAKQQATLEQLGVSITTEFKVVTGLVVLEFDATPQPNAVIPVQPDPVAAGGHLKAQIKRLMMSGLFDYVEPDLLCRSTATPTDSAFLDGTLWGLNNIAAPAAWDVTTGSTAVTVAVIDSGVNYLHQDLAGQMWVNTDEIPNNLLDDDGDGYIDNIYGINAIVDGGDPLDDNQHGSHVAGTIGASANDSGPHVGVAWNVRIMACKFLNQYGSGSMVDAIECIQFGIANGADIMNNSWGIAPNPQNPQGGFSQSMLEAIRAARDAGVLFVCAAGNESNNNDTLPAYPASYNVENVLSVAAIDVNNNIAGFSNYGAQTVHLGAPGVGIYSSIHSGPDAYATLNGTSMAAPHVSGVAALLWAQFPPQNAAEVLVLRQRLLDGVVATPALAGKTTTGGRLNAAGALGVVPDGEMELQVVSELGQTVLANRQASFFVKVFDLFPVANASVNGTFSFGGGSVTFLNNGVAPDLVAGDHIYTAAVTVPDSLDPFTLSVNVTAPSKNPAQRVTPFSVILAPSNDFFAGRTAITSLPATITASTLDATDEPGEPYHVYGYDFGQRAKSLWWTWTAPDAGVYSLSTGGSDFDTRLAVYTGSTINSLQTVGASDDAGFDWTSTVVFPTFAGTAYHFAVDGYYAPEVGTADAGGVELNFSKNNPMVNDDFADRTPFTGLNVTVTGHNIGSTWELQEPNHAGYESYASVWWAWTAPQSGTVVISTAGSSFDTLLAVYTGTSLSQLSPVASNDDAFGTPTSEVRFFAQQNQTYQIAVDGFGTGNVELHVGATPSNDNLANAIELHGELDTSQAYNLGASKEPSEPSIPEFFSDPFYVPNGRSVWWKWTAPRDGNVTVTTDGSNFDTTLVVYTGGEFDLFTTVAKNDDRVLVKIRSSLASFRATAGETYHIQADGFDGLAGVLKLTLLMDGRSHLDAPVLRADGTTTLDLLGEPNGIYVLESSPDLDAWAGVSTNTVVSRRVRFSEITSMSEPKFYRARPASLLSQ